MDPRTADRVRELAHRAGDGIDVALYWDEQTNEVLVAVYDEQTNDRVEFEVEGRHALDAYRHPFAYAPPGRTRKLRGARRQPA